MTRAATQPASLPPEGLPGLERGWSRLIAVPGRGLDEGATREWHCLDTADALARVGAPVAGTILAVHGNPTWSYLWRSMAAESVAAAQAGQAAWRVVAVDQLEMGFSERTGLHRPLRQRVLDLAAFTDALGLEGPVVTLGHDWGGVISLGWAVDHPEQIAAVALLNTAVHHPEGVPIPAPLRLARTRGVLSAATVATTGFLETTLTLATPALAPEVKDAFRAPYRSADRRHGIGGFVADIPVDDRHESFTELERINTGVARLEVPALLQWGPEDPVFTDRYLDDLVDRLPHADVHRYEGASHLVAEERPYAGTVLEWLSPRTLPLVEPLRAEGAERVETGPDPLPLVEPLRAEGAERVETGPDPLPLVEPLRAEGAERVETDPESSDGFDSVSALRARTGSTGGDGDGFDSVSALRARTGSTGGIGGPSSTGGDGGEGEFVPLWHGLDQRAGDDGVAVIDMATRGSRRVSWRQLQAQTRNIAAGLHAIGVRKGDRVSLLVKPGPTLTAVLYACLRIGAIVVVADAGLGVKGLTRAVRGSWPDFIVGERLGLTAARALRWPGVRISAERLPRVAATALGVSHSLSEVAALGEGAPLPAPPAPDDDAAILFTSGSTGPAKGVVYTHGQLSALRDALAAHLEITPDSGLVTGFAPFALLGPALGTRSATPDMDVSSPRTLTATAVAAAVRASDAGVVFLSPAAILNVVATADALTAADQAALMRVRAFLSAGAPIGASLLTAIAKLMPKATPHTPYGMTECLLVTDVTLEGVLAAADAPDAGVCVGAPIGANRVLVSALDADGRPTGAPSAEPGVLGEIVVSAPHLKSNYDRLWVTDRMATRETEPLASAAPGTRWHRTGDLGHLDAQGRVWIEGRTQHVIVTADGPIAPVEAEQAVEAVDAVRRAAVVGVGPHRLRQAVAVVETVPAAARAALADPQLTAAVRASTAQPLAAVLVVPQLPTDVRHNSKIDRSRLSEWAERTLAGAKPSAP